MCQILGSSALAGLDATVGDFAFGPGFWSAAANEEIVKSAINIISGSFQSIRAGLKVSSWMPASNTLFSSFVCYQNFLLG
jgi:hypothetical protein